MNRFILTITLNPVLDKRININNFKLGRHTYKASEAISAGGKGLNVARALIALGNDCFTTGFLGGSNGDRIKLLIKKEGIEGNFVEVNEETRSHLTIYDPVAKKHARILENGPKVNADAIENFLFRYSTFLKKSTMVVLSGRNAYKAPDSFYAKLIQLAKLRKVTVILDTSGKPFLLALKSKPNIIKPNLQEAQEILGCAIKTELQIKKAVMSFHKLGVEIVLLTMGVKGAVLSNKKDIWFAESPNVNVINDIGCGDAFLAGYLNASLKRKAPQECLKMSIAAGAANAMGETPGLIFKEDLVKLSRTISPRKL